MHKAVFIDRDGVVNKDLGTYVTTPDEFVLIPGTIEAFKKLYKSDFKIIIVTNQSGIGKGFYTEKDVEAVHGKMHELLAKEAVKLDGVYYCPHHPHACCICRKPEVGMLEKAIEEHDIDPKKSFLIGDKTSDIKAGNDMGCKTFLVETGYGGKDKKYDVKPDFTVSDLLEAVNTILR
ncbi:MAG: D-glycero-beta-D-manno-heptose 1,7-bisphosphate 7-phosphatase [Nanoarchaeota archaeon]|nr:D-glycero-beta-D-manno-heptose 1,7-bisphosphate 7-phosphatase [Nanoarchaeota archaeon]